MITDDERMARIGGLLRVRGLIMVTHEEQLERLDGRLAALHRLAFLARLVEAKAQGAEPPDFLSWYAGQAVKL